MAADLLGLWIVAHSDGVEDVHADAFGDRFCIVRAEFRDVENTPGFAFDRLGWFAVIFFRFVPVLGDLGDRVLLNRFGFDVGPPQLPTDEQEDEDARCEQELRDDSDDDGADAAALTWPPGGCLCCHEPS